MELLQAVAVVAAAEKAALKTAAGHRGPRQVAVAVGAGDPRLLQIAPEGLEAALVELPCQDPAVRAAAVTPARLAAAVQGVQPITGSALATEVAAADGALLELLAKIPARGFTAPARTRAVPPGRLLAEMQTSLGRQPAHDLEQ